MKLYIVGFGPGGEAGMTLAAREALANSELIVGYTAYVELIKQIFPEKIFVSTPMRHEKERVTLALSEAAKGRDTALICSGDSGIYGLASLAIELSPSWPGVELEIIPGVTAALSGGAVLGSPLTCDFAAISLSDLLTPWEKIEKRLDMAAAADFAIVLYNPASHRRTDRLARACGIILRHRSPDTVCGFVRGIGRSGQESRILTLSELRDTQTDMLTTVFVGSSETKVVNGRMVTPRGYRNV